MNPTMFFVMWSPSKVNSQSWHEMGGVTLRPNTRTTLIHTRLDHPKLCTTLQASLPNLQWLEKGSVNPELQKNDDSIEVKFSWSALILNPVCWSIIIYWWFTKHRLYVTLGIYASQVCIECEELPHVTSDRYSAEHKHLEPQRLMSE